MAVNGNEYIGCAARKSKAVAAAASVFGRAQHAVTGLFLALCAVPFAMALRLRAPAL